MNRFTTKIISGVLLTFLGLIFGSGEAFAAASLSLSPASGTFNRGCSYSVDVRLDTGGAPTDGADVILLFETSKINPTAVSNGNIYSDYPISAIDSSTGRISISGVSSVSSAFTGSGTFATINFTVPSASGSATTTKVSFDFTSGSTTDSNVVERGTMSDILGSANPGNYTIGSGLCPGATGAGTIINGGSGSTGTGSTISGTKKTVDEFVGGKSGLFDQTMTLAVVGGVLTIIGILGLALL